MNYTQMFDIHIVQMQKKKIITPSQSMVD